MAEKSVNTGKISLDPMFYIPEGVEELDYLDEEFSRESSIEEQEDENSFGPGFGEEYDSEEYTSFPGEAGLDAPDILGVIDPQMLRRIPSGQQVVDVLIEITDVAGASNYEIRVTKI